MARLKIPWPTENNKSQTLYYQLNRNDKKESLKQFR